jgi:hypothetical protein
MTPIASIDPRTAAVTEVVAQESATPDVGQQRLAVVERVTPAIGNADETNGALTTTTVTMNF